MKLVDTEETVVLVTGSSLTAEERDRPLAYRLKAEIDRRGAGHAYRRAVVVADALVSGEPASSTSTPPSRSAARARTAWRRSSPRSCPRSTPGEEEVFVQADFEGELKRAALWGVDAAATAAAVEVFTTQGYLEDLLGRIWRFRAGVFGLSDYRGRQSRDPSKIRQRPVHHLRRIPVDDLPQHVRRLEGQALGVDPVTLVADDVAQRDRGHRGARSPPLRLPSTEPRTTSPARWSPTAPPARRPRPRAAAPSRRAGTAGPGGAARATSTTCTGSSKMPYSCDLVPGLRRHHRPGDQPAVAVGAHAHHPLGDPIVLDQAHGELDRILGRGDRRGRRSSAAGSDLRCSLVIENQ